MKRRNRQPQLKKQYLRLRKDHSWDAPTGYKIVVMDRGAVSFNVPTGWLLAKMEPQLELHDAAPPDDNARLSVSFWRLPPGVDWSGLPLDEMLTKATAESSLEILARSELVRSPRTDMELIWTEHRFLDPVEKREAYSRICLARGNDVQVLITFDFWVDDAEKLLPVWNEALRSLQLGRYIEDPTRGHIVH